MPLPPWKRVAATRARSTSVLARGGKSARSVPPRPAPACPASPSPPAPGPGGRGRGGPAPLTHHLQPPSRARSKSQDFEPGRSCEGRGGCTWGSAARPGAGPPSRCRCRRLQAGGLEAPQPAAVAWPRRRHPPRATARPAPPGTRGQWSRPRKLG